MIARYKLTIQRCRPHRNKVSPLRKAWYNQGKQILYFNPGDLVYIRMSTSKRGKTTKFLNPYHGPLRVARQTAENDWEVENRRGKLDVVKVVRMTPYIECNQDNEETLPKCALVDSSDVNLTAADMSRPDQSMSHSNQLCLESPVAARATPTTEDKEEFFDAVEHQKVEERRQPPPPTVISAIGQQH